MVEVDAGGRPDVAAFVESQLAALPQHLRLGVDGVGALVAAGAGRLPVAPVRQYRRLLRSLALFAAHER